MKNAIILHGTTDEKEYYNPEARSLSNAHWLPWLQNQLIIKDIAAATPEIPKAYELNWDRWKREVERFEITPDTIIVGHSCGGGFWVRYLSENKIKVGKVVLVAPWVDPDNSKKSDFFKFKIDPDLVTRTKGVTIFHSSNDMPSIHKTVGDLRQQIKDIKYKEFNNYGHFFYRDMKTEEFPELLEEVLQ
jgi:predicted alpha/beta hydrolase family esterase